MSLFHSLYGKSHSINNITIGYTAIITFSVYI